MWNPKRFHSILDRGSGMDSEGDPAVPPVRLVQQGAEVLMKEEGDRNGVHRFFRLDDAVGCFRPCPTLLYTGAFLADNRISSND